MAIGRSYMIPTEELSLTEIKGFKQAAIEAAKDRALTLGIVGSEDELVVRDIWPQTDLAVTGVANNEWWWTGPLAAVGVWQAYVNAVLGITRTLVFYGIGYNSAAPSVSMVRFRSGPGGTGRTAAAVNLELMQCKMVTDCYISGPITYDRNETVFIDILPRLVVAAPGHNLILRGYIIEPRQELVS